MSYVTILISALQSDSVFLKLMTKGRHSFYPFLVTANLCHTVLFISQCKKNPIRSVLLSYR